MSSDTTSEQQPVPVDDQPAGFDVDAWLNQAQPPQRSVTVYGRSDLLADIQDLIAAADRLDATQPPGDNRPGKPGDDARAQAQALTTQLEQSRMVLHIRGAALDERIELGEKYKAEPEGPTQGLSYTVDLLARCIVQPTMSVAQIQKLRARIGEAQWGQIVDTLDVASQEPISVPLSRVGSALRSTPGS